MSSKPEAQNEPTMEEILASIRRIISEDEPQDGKPAQAAPAPEPAAAPAPQPAAAPPPSGRGAENILDLTKMVAEDGSIVDLEAEAEAEPAVDEQPGDEQPEDAAAEAPEEAPEEIEAAEEPAPEEPAPEESPAEESAAEPEPEPEPEAEAQPEPEPEPEPEQAEAAAEPEPEDEPEDEMIAAPAEGQALAPAGDDSEYVSAVTAAAATASLAAVTKAAMANRQGDAVAIGGGRTLEELVRTSLAPELKGWLDENLPELVERIVREEIRKMIRRAEDQ